MTSRGSTASKSAWQLVEVPGKDANKDAGKPRSQPGTPLLTVQRTPQQSPALGPRRTPQSSPVLRPADGALPPPMEEFNIDEQQGDTQEEPVDSVGHAYERWGDDPDHQDEDGFSSRYLLGDWTDNIGHRVLVTQTEIGARRDRRRRNKGGGKGRGQLGFLAVMYKFGLPDKRFNINRDRTKMGWTCGNGVLDMEESGEEKMVWRTADGRISTWTRSPPEGPVYFDAPPAPMMQEEMIQQPLWYQPGMQVHPDGPVYFDPDHNLMGPPQGEWKGLHLPPEEGDPLQMQQGAGVDTIEVTEVVVQDGSAWNVQAPEFVPSAFAAPPASASPNIAPAPAPATPAMSVHPAPTGAQAIACAVQLSEGTQSPDVNITGHRLEWTLPDDWGQLKRLPKDFSITSPMFGVRQAANMQLMFYPNGSRTAEAGRCTIALMRAPNSAGIKFEFSVNGRGSGPKVCLGRRYLGDYQKPYGDDEESKTRQVLVCMQVLEVLGI